MGLGRRTPVDEFWSTHAWFAAAKPRRIGSMSSTLLVDVDGT